MDKKEIRRKANTYFFTKVAINILLIILGAVLISLFLRQMQQHAALQKQKANSEQALSEAVTILETNVKDADELTKVFHSGNQAMLEDLQRLLNSGVYDQFSASSPLQRATIFQNMIDRSGLDYLYMMNENGEILIAPSEELIGVDTVENGLLTAEERDRLLDGTAAAGKDVQPVLVNNSYGCYYFYSVFSDYGDTPYCLILGADAHSLDVQLETLTNISGVLSRSAIGNGGFLFAVDSRNGTFTFYRNGDEDLTGLTAADTGLNVTALEDDYSGKQRINGVDYWCVSRSFEGSMIICAAAPTDAIFDNDRYVLFWSITGFVMVMILCLSYAVIVRNDFVAHAVETDKALIFKRGGHLVFFNRSIFRKIFPLMLAGVVIIFGISFYTQTLLEISQGIDNSKTAIEEITARYEQSESSRDTVKTYYETRSLAMARLISYLLEEDPYVLNTPSERYHFVYDEDGERIYLRDDEGNILHSVSQSSVLQALCDSNSLESIYIFDEDGHVIATNTANWFFVLSHDPQDQSYPFRDVLDGHREYYIQEAMENDLGEKNQQYVGVPLSYYTTVDPTGATLYLSRGDYEQWLSGGLEWLSGPDGMTGIAVDPNESSSSDSLPNEQSGAALSSADVDAEPEEKDATWNQTVETADVTSAAVASAYASQNDNHTSRTEDSTSSDSAWTPVTPRTGMLQIGLNAEITEKLLASTELEYIFSSDMLEDGFIVVFDESDEHRVLYSPYEARIGMTAAEIGVPEKALSGEEYYGFTKVGGVRYFQFFHQFDDYFLATALPVSGMYTSRLPIALVTAAVSLILILFLSSSVVCTTPHEEFLYATMSEEQEELGWDNRMFSIILPSGKTVSTTKASARWDNARTRWAEKSPEQKLLTLVSIALFIFILYVTVAIIWANIIFPDGSIIQYILSGNWDRGPNIFAGSTVVLVLIFTVIGIELFKIPVRIVTDLFGARSETIGHLLLSIVKYGGAIGAVFYSLYLLGVDSTGLIASASILSLVVGLGAQSLIKDIIAGIFIVFEGEFRVGDIITISDFRGTVIDIGLRTTKIMAPNGNIKIYNNSEISGVLNMTKETSVATTRISIEYGQDLRYVEAVLKRELPKLAEENSKIMDGPLYLGVSSLGESGVELLIICKCFENDILGVTRDLNRGVLQIFYDNDINVPFPNVTVSQLHTEGRKTYKDLDNNNSAEDEETTEKDT